MIKLSDFGDCSHCDTAVSDVGGVVCLDCGAEVGAPEADDLGEVGAADRTFSLLLAATRDRLLTLGERAAAAAALDGILGEMRPIPEIVAGALTQAGREAARSLLPEPRPEHFPRAVEILLSRLRAAGHPCSAVACERTTHESRPGYRVTWEGDGWERFSRRSPAADAPANRAELQRAAESMGLVVEAEAAPSLLVVEPDDGPIVVRRDTLRRVVREMSPLERALDSIDRGFADLDAQRDAALARRGRSPADVARSLERAAAHRRVSGLPARVTYEQLVADLGGSRD